MRTVSPDGSGSSFQSPHRLPSRSAARLTSLIFGGISTTRVSVRSLYRTLPSAHRVGTRSRVVTMALSVASLRRMRVSAANTSSLRATSLSVMPSSLAKTTGTALRGPRIDSIVAYHTRTYVRKCPSVSTSRQTKNPGYTGASCLPPRRPVSWDVPVPRPPRVIPSHILGYTHHPARPLRAPHTADLYPGIYTSSPAPPRPPFRRPISWDIHIIPPRPLRAPHSADPYPGIYTSSPRARFAPPIPPTYILGYTHHPPRRPRPPIPPTHIRDIRIIPARRPTAPPAPPYRRPIS